jgi:hypothetical protein
MIRRRAADPPARDDKDARHDQPGPAAVRPVTGIDRINPSRVHGNPHLARAGHRISSLAKPQLLRPAELADQHRSHQQGSFRVVRQRVPGRDTYSAGNGGRALEASSSAPRNRRGSGTAAGAPILRA